MTGVTFEVDAEAAIAYVRGAADKLSDLSAPMQEVAAFMESEIRGYFAREAGPDGGWAALAPSTLAQKRSGAILRETSTLAGSVTSSVSSTEARIGVGTFYGIFHQLGTRKMPQRKIVGFKPEHPAQIKAIFGRHIGGLR